MTHRKMGEVELADALIRTLDVGGHCGWVYAPGAQVRQDYVGWSVGRRHLHINRAIVDLAFGLERMPELASDWRLHQLYGQLVDRIIQVAESFGYDIETAMQEKLAYNANRPDHKRENRAKEHGKKF